MADAETNLGTSCFSSREVVPAGMGEKRREEEGVIAVLPGIPPAGSPEAAAFWLAFYAGLYSGLLYSLVTGVMVGLIVLLAGRWADTRRYRAGLEREVSLTRERLRTALRQVASFMVNDDAANTGSQAARALTDVLQDQPLDLWIRHLPRSRPFFDALRTLQQAHGLFLATADAVNLHLRNLVRNRLREWAHAHDGEHIKFILARARGMDAKEILPWIHNPHVNTEAVLAGTYDSVQANGLSQEVLSAYLEAIRVEGESAEVVRRLLDALDATTTQPSVATLATAFVNHIGQHAADIYRRVPRRLQEEWEQRWARWWGQLWGGS